MLLTQLYGLTFWQTSAGGDYVRQAEQKGLQGKQALAYGTIMGSLESGTEWIGKKLTKGVGKAGKELLKATGKKEIKSKALKALASYGLDIGENFFEEAIMEPLEEVVTQATGGKADYSNIKARMLQSGIDGALTSIIMGGASAGVGSAMGVMTKAENGQQITQEEIKQALIDINKSEEVDIEKLLVDNFQFNPEDFVDIKEVNQARDSKMEKIAGELTPNERLKLINNSDLDDKQKESLSEIAEKYQLTLDEIQNAINKTLNGEYAQNQKTTTQNNEVLNGEQQITQTEGKISQNETSNDIGLNLRKSIDAYNNSRQEGDKIFDINDENTKKEIDAIQKVAEKRGLNVTFDESRFNNNNINAFYEYDDNGNVANIVLNPNTSTKKYVQNLVVHEMTHSFEGSKEYDKLSRAVLDYAKRTGEYDKAFEDLKATYEKVYGNSANLDSIVEKEAVANILGEKLGDQEFVNDLVNGTYSTENKSLVQKIYDFVKNQINRFKGYKDQEQYWNHVKELFDTAMNKSEISQEGLKASKEATAMTNITDSQGRNLSQGQVDYFKDSKIRNKNGNLQPVYHMTEANFNKIDFKKNAQGLFWITSSKEALENGDVTANGVRNKENVNIMELYANMKNPAGFEEYDKYTIEQLKEKGYDGIWFDDGDGTYVGAVFNNPNQIKNTDNLNPTENNDIRYSVETGENADNIDASDLSAEEILNAVRKESQNKTKNTLLAIHNLTEEKLRGILELGGFPVPSIAITNQAHTQFGDISIIFDKSTIDPSRIENEVYDRDVWSPTFPQVDYEINEDLSKASKELGLERWQLRDYAEDSSKPEYLIDKLSRTEEVVDKFIKDNNLKYETKYQEAKLTKWYNEQDSVKKFISENKLNIEEFINNKDIREQYYETLRNEFNKDNDEVEAINKQIEHLEYWANNDRQRLRESTLARDFDVLNGETQVVDDYETKKEKRKVAEENGIKKYLEAQMKNIYGEKGIYNGKDYVTENGRRTFWQLHDEYNLENIVEALTKKATKGTQDWIAGYGQIQAQMAKQFSSISDIKSNEGLLTNLSDNNELLTEARDNIESDIDEIVDNNDTDYSVVSELLADFASGDLTIENFRDLTNRYYQSSRNVSDKLIKKIINDLNNLKNLPTDYFEAKPQRAVGLDEVKAIVLPSDIDADLKQQLQDRGMRLIEYNPEIEGDREAKLKGAELQDLRFSKDTSGAWNNFIEKYFKNEGTGTAIKDMKKLPVKTYSMQDIDNVLNETTLSDELKEEFRNDLKGKTITKEIFNEYKDAIKQVEKDYENYNAERKPSWDDIGEVFEQPSEEVESPLQDRDIETIGKETKKNAYQYENPEVKPYFQEMAQMIGEDLAYASDPMNRRTKKGGGTVLQANTKAINDLHNKYGYSYEQIGIGLNNIIEDNGAENNAVSKKIEFYIDDALRNGYRNIQGQYIQPNQDYINTIQYSMETENQAEKIEEEKPKPKVLNPTQISNLTLEDVSTTPKLPNKKYKEGSKVSSFVSNIENDVGFLNEEEKQELLKDDNVKFYAGITNADTLAQAYDNLKENGKDATIKWYAKPTANATAEDVATGWILLKQYSDKGDTEGMVNVAKKLRDMGTKAGQTVQAFNILSRLTPEGMVAYTQGELQDAYNEMIKGKSKKWIDQHKSDFDLSQDEIAFIMDTMQNLPAEDPTNNNYDRKVALGQIQKLFTDKIPPENNKIKAWMRISMLFNPKTQVRNVAGNAGVIPVNMTSDFLGSKVDKVLSKYTGVRTLGNPNAKAYLKGMKEGFYQSYNDFKLGINTRDIEQNKFEFGQGKAFKDKGIGKALNRVDNMLNFIMDFGDRGFSQASFVNSLNNQMLLNGVTTPTQDMIDIATQEALSRTWNDDNNYTRFVLNIRKGLNALGGKNYGLGDVLIPFAKTPANLTKAIVEYSPVGLTKQILNIKDIKNAIETDQFTAQQQHDFADKMGKGLAGTLLYIAGYALAQAGIATGEPDEDKDVKNFMKNSLGIAPYSIKIGDKSFTYDWAQPVATPLAIMTNLYQTNKNNPDATMLDKIMSATNIGTNQLMEQSFMESLNEVLNGNGEITERIQKAILDLPARAIPTFSKQIADMVDGTQRTSFEYGQHVKSAINSAKAKLPFVSKELTPVVDTLGNEVEKYGGENNWFNVFFNPANMNKGKKTKAGEEIYNVYQETGDTTIFPVTAPYYVNQDGAKITMDSKQRAEYQKTAGDYTEETVNKLINDSDYQKLDDSEKAEILSQVVKDSNEKAKRDVLNINNKSSDLGLIDEVGADYYTYKIATKGMSKQGEKCEALEKKDYSNQNKQLIYESEINKEDKTFEGLKKINKNFNMNEYLKYKSQTFSGDNKKEDTINYVNGLDLDGIERLYIIGRTYKLNKTEKQQLETLLRNKMPSQDMLDILQTIK